MKKVAICRSASEPVGANSVRGDYRCKICSAPLQVTRGTRDREDFSELILLCNPCGRRLTSRLPDNLLAVELTPEAEEKRRQGRISEANREFIESLVKRGKLHG